MTGEVGEGWMVGKGWECVSSAVGVCGMGRLSNLF